MLREEQIDLRRRRAKEAKLVIENVGKNRVYSQFQVTNPETQGQYEVQVRGFDTGDNTCTCPDFKSNTLGTCKHIEAVMESLREEYPPHLQKKKAVIARPEVYLHYGERLRLGLHLPPRHSDKLAKLAGTYFDENRLWTGKGRHADLIVDLENTPEVVTVDAEALDFIDREIERAELLQREADLLAELEAGTLDLNLLDVPLYDYQIRGALFLACRVRSILGDDMGLGKTLQTLAAVELLARERNLQRALVVAPASVKYQWETEIRKFTSRPVQVIEGKADSREEQYAEPAFYRLVNYEQVIRDRDLINAWKPDVVILDEAQRIKNWESKTSREVKKLRSRYAMVLTGTPLENKLEELYSIVQFVDERRFGPAFQFLHDHRVLDDEGKLTAYRNLDSIREKLAPIFLRRTRGDVLTQLPERTDSTIFVELAEEQRGPYEDQRAAIAMLLQKNFLTDLDRKRVLARLVHMRTICDSLFLFDSASRASPKLDEFAELLPELLGIEIANRSGESEAFDSDGEVPPPPSWGRSPSASRRAMHLAGGGASGVTDGSPQLESPNTPHPPSHRMRDETATSPTRGEVGADGHSTAAGESASRATHKAVVFSQWETMVLETAKVLDTLGIGYAILHGSLSGKERKEALAKFQTDDACRVFLSTDAGGTGLNLQVADTVVNLELPWNPAVLEQRIARVHRMGQKRPVRVLNFVTRGTIEERVLKAIAAKQSLFDGLFEGDEDEIAIESAGGSKLLGAVRNLLNDEPPPAAEVPSTPVPASWVAVNHLLDGLAALITEGGPVPPPIREKLRGLLQKADPDK